MQKQTNFVSRQIVNTTWSLTYTGPPIPTYANTLIHVLNAISCNDAPGSDWSSQAASWAEANIRTTATKISQQIKALNKTGATLLSIPSLVRMVSLGCCVVTVTLLPSLDQRSVSRSRHSTKWGPCFCPSPPSSEWSVWVAVLWPSPCSHL